MNTQPIKSLVMVLMPAAALTLASCSSTPPPAAPPAPPQAQAPAPTGLVDAGVMMETGTGMVTVESIDATNRTLLLRRTDGGLATFKAGPEVRRFDRIKIGDQITSTMTDNCTVFVVKGQMTPSAAAKQAIVRTPEGQNVGGLVVEAINVDARVLDVDLAARRVLVQYGPTQTKSVAVRPTVDLNKVAVGDTVLVRGTRTISIMVASP